MGGFGGVRVLPVNREESVQPWLKTAALPSRRLGRHEEKKKGLEIGRITNDKNNEKVSYLTGCITHRAAALAAGARDAR